MSYEDTQAMQVLAAMVVVVCIVVLVIAVLIYDYRVKAKRMQTAAMAQDGASSKELWDTARRMEARIGYLETVLDTEAPGWRNRSEVR